ncbi:MAG TPA: AAA family ATPase [Methylomusa anaerophila]|uniref:AAA family ATPase n=1 Tax=Methylomusa anaerophila TaxID=1930071 RepID=UPI0013156D79|nr:AAA family ATPase [Methylomusa anaerophila]HML90068.1 AAA family ATPase [Methylomusa anaerophila]
MNDLIHYYLIKGNYKQKPILINLSGIPASGKTTLIKQLFLKDQFILINHDDIFSKLEKKSMKIAVRYAYRILINCIRNKYNIIYDHCSISSRYKCILNLCQKYNYSLINYYCHTDVSLAVERAFKREKLIGQVTSIEKIYTKQLLLLNQFSDLISNFDTCYLYYNSKNVIQPLKVAKYKKMANEWVVYNSLYFDELNNLYNFRREDV